MTWARIQVRRISVWLVRFCTVALLFKLGVRAVPPLLEVVAAPLAGWTVERYFASFRDAVTSAISAVAAVTVETEAFDSLQYVAFVMLALRGCVVWVRARSAHRRWLGLRIRRVQVATANTWSGWAPVSLVSLLGQETATLHALVADWPVQEALFSSRQALPSAMRRRRRRDLGDSLAMAMILSMAIDNVYDPISTATDISPYASNLYRQENERHASGSNNNNNTGVKNGNSSSNHGGGVAASAAAASDRHPVYDETTWPTTTSRLAQAHHELARQASSGLFFAYGRGSALSHWVWPSIASDALVDVASLFACIAAKVNRMDGLSSRHSPMEAPHEVSLAELVTLFHAAIIHLASSADINDIAARALALLANRRVSPARSVAASAGRCHTCFSNTPAINYAPCAAPSVARFVAHLAKRTVCMYARGARLWGSPPLKGDSLGAVVAASLPTLRRFAAAAGSESLDGFVLELPVDDFGDDAGAIFCAALRGLAPLAPADRSFPPSPADPLVLCNQAFHPMLFVPGTTSAPPTSPRFMYGLDTVRPSSAFLLLVPSSAFAVRNVGQDDAQVVASAYEASGKSYHRWSSAVPPTSPAGITRAQHLKRASKKGVTDDGSSSASAATTAPSSTDHDRDSVVGWSVSAAVRDARGRPVPWWTRYKQLESTTGTSSSSTPSLPSSPPSSSSSTPPPAVRSPTPVVKRATVVQPTQHSPSPLSATTSAVSDVGTGEDVWKLLAAFDADADLVVTRDAVTAFVAATGFRPLSCRDLYQRYLATLGGADGATEPAFHSFAAALFPNSPSAEALTDLLSTMFGALDLDDNGVVDPGEAVLALVLLCTGTLDDRIDICFDAFDADKSGSLDRAELHNLITSTLLKTRSLVDDLFSPFEPDTAEAAEHPVPLRLFSLDDIPDILSLRTAAFDAADRDGSGDVDRAEFAEWARQSRLMSDFLTMHDTLFTRTTATP